jgi:hypothetical protein
MSRGNGQHRPQPRVSFDDPRVIARLAVCAWLHGEPEAQDAIQVHRPDLDPDELRLMVEIVAMTFADMLNLPRVRAMFFQEPTR